MKTWRPLLLPILIAALACDREEPAAKPAAEEEPRETMLEQGLRGDAERFTNEAFAFIASGDYRQANITARRAVLSDPESGSAQNALAWASMYDGNRTQELLAALEAVRLEPDSAHFRRTLGIAYQDSGRPRDAINSFRDAVRLNPSDTLAWRDLGRAAAAIGNEALADSAFDRLVELEPTYFDTTTIDAGRRP